MAPENERLRRLVAHPDNWEAAEKKALELGLKVLYDDKCPRTHLFVKPEPPSTPDR